MKRYLYDIEGNDLLPGVTRMWILYLIDLETGEKQYFLEGDHRWMALLDNCEHLVGHNITGYDNPTLEKLYGYKIKPHTKLVDTIILSRVLNYRRFGDRGHGLAVWGEYLDYEKIDFHDFSKYSEEMRVYCERDCDLNVKVYNILMAELAVLREKQPMIMAYLRAEHAVARWSAQAELKGWPFDRKKALELRVELEADLDKAYKALEPKLGMKAVMMDKVPHENKAEVKQMRYTKAGLYYASMADWFELDPMEGRLEPEERDVNFEGEFCRVKFQPLSLDSTDDVKIFLFRNNWQPTEWNYKKDKETGRRTKEKSSPKITEDSLEFLGGDGKLYVDFSKSKARYGILKTWIEECDADDLLHGGCMTIGTPSMRATHKLIVNVPSAEAPWGRQMRELFTSHDGWALVGCDSASNQARGLAHYLGDAEFTNTLINGDIHKYNAVLLDKVLAGMGHNWTEFIVKSDKAQIKGKLARFLEKKGITKREYLESRLRSNRKGAKKWAEKFIFAVKRAAAKRILYAFLFGASGGKLWLYIYGVQDVENGNKLKNGFTKAVPGFKDLLDKLAAIYKSTTKYGDGYIPGIAGNRIYVDSFHKLLVYLLQSTEKATCSAAVMLIMERLDAAGIPYIPCIMMHDEADFMVPEEYAEQARLIGKQAFADGPKLFGIDIMDGSGKVGKNWYDVH